MLGLNCFGQILVEDPSVDLGDVYEHKGEVAAVFQLTNPYKNDTIRIHDVITSCGCTVVLSQDTIIPPNETIPLKLSYDPSGRSGLFNKSVEVVSRIGIYDQHRLFLKISGNVVNENPAIKQIDAELKEYLVAPIQYYAITHFDTSYLDFNFFVPFVNDLSYEIDFYQFTTVGFKIGIRNKSQIEPLENLIKYSKHKIQREFKMRGYNLNTVFFDEPVFEINSDLPAWASASIKLYSVNFGSELIEASIIKTNKEEFVENKDLMLNYSRFSKPTAEEIIEQVNFDRIENKLFMEGSLDLQGVIFSSSRMSFNEREKLAKKVEKMIMKYMKTNSGVSKKNFAVHFDSLGFHPENKYKFMLWSKADEEEQQNFTYEVKQDHISPPLLPTYKFNTVLGTKIDESSQEFQHFWSNLSLNHKMGYNIELLIESSVSKIPREGEDLMTVSRQNAENVKKFILKKFLDQFGKLIDIKTEAYVNGPAVTDGIFEHADLTQFEYINIIPLVHHNKGTTEKPPNPYMVNFDYFFNGVDTSSWVFSRLGDYMIEEVKQNGFVKLIIESSISQIPIDQEKSNDYLVFERALESERRIRDYLSKRLVDPNRLIFVEERFLIQGPKYDPKIPIVAYRKFQYLKVLPEKYIKQ